MTKTVDATTRLMFLMEVMSDEQDWEKLVLEVSQKTGLSYEKVDTALRALYEVLVKNLPEH
jgi:hypothetical protein